MCRLEEFYDDTTTDDIRGDATEGYITAQYVNNRVIIRGPYGDPSKGGFEILRTRHLLYMDSVANLNTVEGFSSGAKLQIDLNLWKFLHYAARLWGLESQRSICDLQNIWLAMMTITEMDKIKEMAEAEEIRKGKQKNLLFFLVQKHPLQQLLKSKHKLAPDFLQFKDPHLHHHECMDITNWGLQCYPQ